MRYEHEPEQLQPWRVGYLRGHGSGSIAIASCSTIAPASDAASTDTTTSVPSASYAATSVATVPVASPSRHAAPVASVAVAAAATPAIRMRGRAAGMPRVLPSCDCII